MFVARSSIGFLPMPLRFLTLPSRGACRVVETYMYLLNTLSATFTCRRGSNQIEHLRGRERLTCYICDQDRYGMVEIMRRGFTPL